MTAFEAPDWSRRLRALAAVRQELGCDAFVISATANLKYLTGFTGSAGLLVDQVLGVQQVVLREVAGIDTRVQVFAGGAVLGDGRVAMVVDVDKLGALVAQVAEA